MFLFRNLSSGAVVVVGCRPGADGPGYRPSERNGATARSQCCTDLLVKLRISLILRVGLPFFCWRDAMRLLRSVVCVTAAAAFMVLELAVPIALARDYGQWENSPPHVRRWFQGLKQPDNPRSLVLRRSRRVRSRYLRGRRRPLRCGHHRRQGRDPERDENPRAQSQDEMGRGKPHGTRHHLHRCPGTGLLLRRPWRCVTTFAGSWVGSSPQPISIPMASRSC